MITDTNTPPRPKGGRKPGTRKRPEQCATASRLIAKAKRKGAIAKDAPENVVLFAGASKKTTNKAGNNKITTTLVAQAKTITLSADTLADAARVALLVWYRNAILTGMKPDGSAPQVSLSQRSMVDTNRLTKFRGAKSGHMADNLRSPAITGTTTKARAVILPPTDRNVFMATEAGRGIRYMTLKGEAALVVQAATQAWIKAALDGTVRGPERGEKTGAGADV